MDHTYRPNWADPRVKTRVERVLAWCTDNLRETSAKPVPKQQLESVFGPIGNRLSDYLRATLLIRSDLYKPGLRYYKYQLRKNSIAKLASRACVNEKFVDTSTPEQTLQRLNDKHKDELSKLAFTYKTKSNRYWHPLQNIKSDLKDRFWSNRLPYSYDIEACAATLFFQTALKCGLNTLISDVLKDYVDNKTEWRSRIAELSGLPAAQNKKLINSLFNGGRLAKNSYCTAFQMLREHHSPGQATHHMDLLQNDRDLSRLRVAIRHGWSRIANKLNMNLNQSQLKSVVYFGLERRVLDAMKAELDSQGLKYFTEHDGFRTDKQVDLPKMYAAVKAATGYDIRLAS